MTVNFEIFDNQSRSSLGADSAVSGSDGIAFVTYTAGSSIGAVDIVRVTVAGVADPQDAVITVDPPGAGTLVVTVTASPDTIEAVTDVGANNQSTITATVTSDAGAVANQSVTFTTSAGTICPGTTPCEATTNASGVAKVILQSSTNLETADVQAQAGTASGTTTVAFIAGPAVDFALSASPPNLTADNNSTSTVATVVRDSAAHLVADGTTVNFSLKAASIGAGDFVEIPSSDQTKGGVASVTFRAGGDATINGGDVDIRASSGGANSDDADSTYGDGLITLIPEVIGSVTLTLDSSTLTESRLAGMKGGLSTRMGAALRHAGNHLLKQQERRKLVLLLTDGEPADIDERDPQHLRHDTKKAVEELYSTGVLTYCLTLDPNADDYVKRIFGANNYTIIDNVDKLPEQLPTLFASLTS